MQIYADEPCSALTQSQLRLVVQQMLSKMPVLWDVRNQGLLSSIAFWLHTYCLEIWFPPQFGPKCKNEIYFRAMWFHFFCICVYDMNSVRTTAFPKEVSKSILSLIISYWNGNTNKAVLISFFRDFIGEKKTTSQHLVTFLISWIMKNEWFSF